MKGISTFQLILFAVFGVAILAALILFATSRSSTNGPEAITLWGTVPATDFDQTVANYNSATGMKLTITYVQEQPDSFDQDLIEALADGDGPDAILLSQDDILQFENKIVQIPYSSYSASNFQNNFVDEASLYTTSTGILAFPLSVDPLVMYWNKDMLNAAAVTAPPETWDQFFNFATQFTEKDKADNITQSAVALGEYANITHAKEVLSTLFIQAGTPIVSPNAAGVATGGTTGVPSYLSVLNQAFNYTVPPGQSALSFFTEFSNPAKPDYSWNSALSDSLDDFAEGNLAVYFGLASDYETIQQKNPNLNFAVAPLPQPLDATSKVTFGDMNAFAVLKSSPNVNATFQTLSYLFSDKFASLWAAEENIAPARRDLLAVPQTSNAADQVFYDSALIARGWLDPDSAQTDTIFGNMITSVTSGADMISDAVQGASDQIQLLLQPAQ